MADEKKPDLKLTIKQPKRPVDGGPIPDISQADNKPPAIPLGNSITDKKPPVAPDAGKKPNLKITVKQPKRPIEGVRRISPPAAPSPTATNRSVAATPTMPANDAKPNLKMTMKQPKRAMDGPRGPAAASPTPAPAPVAKAAPVASVKDDKPDLKMTMKQPKRAMDETSQTLRPKQAPVASPNPAAIKPKPPPPPAIKSPVEESVTEIPGIVDPSKARDKQSDGGEEKSNLSSDTVVLKVVKEKKKKLAGILSQSQTIRLRPSGGDDKAANSSSRENQATSTPAPTPLTKGTLKIKAPATPGSGIKSAPVTLQKSALKIKTTSSNESKKLGSAAAQAPSGGTTSQPTTKATLKIKVPTGGGQQLKSTLKIKSPVAAGGTRGSGAPVGTAGKGQAKSGKALKLKAVSRAQQPDGTAQKSAATKTAASEARAKQVFQGQSTSQAGIEPGIVYVLSAVASLIAVGITAALMISQYYSLF